MSTADWDHPFWTNKQHTARTLAALGYRVFYIDTLGSRQIRFNKGKDAKRIWQRIKRLFAKPREVEQNIWVWSPCVLPPSESRGIQLVNRILFNGLLTYWLRSLSFNKQALFWTYNPLSLLYINPKKFVHVIYHCVDNIAEQPGAFSSLIQTQEKNLFQQAHYTFVTSRALEKAAKEFSDHVHYFPNVVDFDHFHQACQDIKIPADLAAIPEPRAGFIGAISAYKVDVALFSAAASRLPHVSFVLIGAIGEGDPDTRVEQLLKLPNVYLLGPRTYAELPHYLKGLDVCLIPANQNEYTKAMFPMKFFEYLAAGKPIVAADLPALREYRDAYYAANTPEEFAEAIRQAINDKDQARRDDRLDLARQNTYLARTHKMLSTMAMR